MKDIKYPEGFFKGARVEKLRDRASQLLADLGVSEGDEDPDIQNLSDATIVLELAVILLFARHSKNLAHFKLGIAMIGNIILDDTEAILKENAVAA